MAHEEGLLSDDPATLRRTREAVRSAVEGALANPMMTNPFHKPEFRSRLRQTAIFTPFKKSEREEVSAASLPGAAAAAVAAAAVLCPWVLRSGGV